MKLTRGIRRLFRLRPAVDADVKRDVEEEMRLHVALRAADLEQAGRSPAEAEMEARRLFAAGDDTVRALYAAAWDRHRRIRFRERWESWIQDLRYAGRGLGRDRLLTGFVITILALGMGLNVSAYSLLDRVLLRDPPHVEDPAALVRLYGTVTTRAGGEQTSSWIPVPEYLALRESSRAMQSVAAYRLSDAVIGRGLGARKRRVGQIMGPFFQTLGVDAVRGRVFAEDEDAASSGPVALLSSEYWQSMLGGDPAAVGGTIAVGETSHTIVGILPPGFSGPQLRRVDLWVVADSRTARSMNWNIVGRMRPGVTAGDVTAEAVASHERIRGTAGDWQVGSWFQDARVSARSIRMDETGREPFEATMTRWLAGVSAVILLVALANVVSLLLVRLARRRRELSVRVALGAGRGRVIRLVWLEGALLALGGGLASLAVARAFEPLVRRALFANEATWSFRVLDLRLLGIALAIALVTALFVGLFPALQAGGSGLALTLRAGARGDSGGNPRIRGILTTIQAALSVMLLVGAGLFMRSVSRVNAVDLGVDRDAVVTATAVLPPPAAYTRQALSDLRETEIDIFRRMAESARALPGVERAAVAVGLPLDGGSFSASVFVDGMDSVPSMPGGGPYASAVGADYFETAGTSLLRGRPFASSDREGTERVMIVGETMAARLWPGSDPLGECVRLLRRDAPCHRVVGVAEDVHRVGLREQPSLQYYVPLGQQQTFSGATLLIRTARSASLSWPDLERRLLGVDPRIRAVEIRWLSEALDGELRPLRLGTVLFGLSGILALAVAIAGLYGLMSYMVAWRTREIGVRVAIGATTPSIIRQVMGSGAALAGIGVSVGLVLAYWGGRRLEPYLFETSGADPVVFAGVAAALMLVGLLAGVLPARRALSISPTEALRAE